MEWSFGDGAGDPYDALRRELVWRDGSDFADAPPFVSGLVGFLSYETAHLIEPRVPVGTSPEAFPDALFVRCAAIVAFDHRLDLVHVIVEAGTTPGGDPDAAYAGAVREIHAIVDEIRAAEEDGEREPRQVARSAFVAVEPERPAAEFEHAVARAKEYIEAGDCQQVVISQRFSARLEIDPFAIYRELRLLNPSPYLFYFEYDGRALVGSSPEALARIRNRELVVRPIAGTRPRGRDPAEDDQLIEELLADPKENAEHVMLVDLARNDVGRIARFGSERVDELMTVERYSHVMHLTSEVSGELLAGRGPVDVLRATLPAGTVSGAPKVRAMEIIDELEPTKRGPYAGVVGYIDFSGNLDTAIAIRTLVATADGKASVQAGAGIVADSDPAAEDEECAAKAAAVLAAVAGARQLSSERGSP